MNHIYLSPHLDDAVLSCGGAIQRQVSAGEPVRVITLVAGDVAPGTALSPFARRLHDDWGGHPRPFALRRAEDSAALCWLGAEAQHLDCLDAIYRVVPGGEWPYIDGRTLFGTVHAADPLLEAAIDRFTAVLGKVPAPWTAYAPLGVGRHVDHQIVHAAARKMAAEGARLAFYEDYPYADTADATEAALIAAGGEGWRGAVIPLSAAAVASKVTALGYYRSQLGILFGGAEAMTSRVWAFAATRAPGGGLAERIWWPT